MLLKDRVAIVTGSSSGIGKGIALAFAREGARVVVSGRNVERTNGVADEIKRSGGAAIAVLADISNKDDIKRLFDQTFSAFGRLDILVNNAADVDSKRALFADMDMDTVVHEINTDILGTIRCCHFAVPRMLKQGSGRIISITSASSKQPPVRMTIYGAGKAAIAAFSRSLALELAGTKITVNCVAPGLIRTEAFARAESNTPELAKEWAALVPMHRPGEVPEIVDMVMFLASDKSSFITGQNYSVDGGRTW